MAETAQVPSVVQPQSISSAPSKPSAVVVDGDAGRPGAIEALDEAFGESGGAVQVPLKNGNGASEKVSEPTSNGKPPGGENADTPEPAPFPFDDEFSGLEPLEDGKQDQTGSGEALPDLSTEEAIKKACNPDGKASVEQQLEHAQRLLGKHSARVHQAEQIAATFAPFLTRDEKTGAYTGFNLVALGEFMGQDRVSEQLASQGLKLVPLDWEPKPVAENSDGITPDMFAELARVPGVDADTKEALLNPRMSVEDKLELVKADANLLVEAKLLARERARAAATAKQQAETKRVADRNARLERLAAADRSFGHLLKESAPGAKDSPLDRAFQLLAAMEKSGEALADVVYRLAKYERLANPSVRRAQAEAIRQSVEKELMAKFHLTMPGGGSGGVLPGGARGGDREDALREAFGG